MKCFSSNDDVAWKSALLPLKVHLFVLRPIDIPTDISFIITYNNYYIFQRKLYEKLNNLKRVHPIFFSKITKIDHFEKSAPYPYLSKNNKNWSF